MTANTDYRDILVDILGQGIKVDGQQSAGSSGRSSFEIINGCFKTQMQYPILTIRSRKLNYRFMAAEAAWILSGSNYLDDVQWAMKRYTNYSDDGVFLRGAYGPKVVDQLPFIVYALRRDINSRQAVLSIWRERPDLASKDIPCTLSMQFIVRSGVLHTVVMMRSWDVYWGLPYDIFTFSAISAVVASLVPGVEELGSLHVNAGSFHLYEDHRSIATDLVRYPFDLIVDPTRHPPAFTLEYMRGEPNRLQQELSTVARRKALVTAPELHVTQMLSALIHHET